MGTFFFIMNDINLGPPVTIIWPKSPVPID